MKLILLTMAAGLAACSPASDRIRSDHHIARDLQLADTVIVCFGDSLTTGLGVAPPEAYPQLLARQLGVNVVVEGRPGLTAEAALAHIDKVLAYRPWLVVVELGGNDALRLLEPERTERALRTLLTRLSDAGSRALLVEIPAPPGTPYQSIYPRLAADLDVPLLADVVPLVLADPRLTHDGLHPNATGHRKIANALSHRIRPWLRARPP